MKKLLLGIALSFLLVTNAFADDLSRAHSFVDAEILTAALLNGEFDPIVTQLNDLTGANLKSDIAITSSGTQAFSGTFGVSGTFNATGTSINLGNGGTDLLTLNCAGGITFTPAATWTFTGAQTVSGTWADLGIVTTADINGGTIDGVVIGGASAAAATVTTLNTGGKFTAGANEIECSNVDITGGTITGVTLTGTLTAGTSCVQNPMTSLTVTTTAHGLGAIPTMVVVYMECLTAEQGYSIGNRIYIATEGSSGSYGSTIEYDATNVSIISSNNTPRVQNKTTPAGDVALTLANWKVVVVPYKLN